MRKGDNGKTENKREKGKTEKKEKRHTKKRREKIKYQKTFFFKIDFKICVRNEGQLEKLRHNQILTRFFSLS